MLVGVAVTFPLILVFESAFLSSDALSGLASGVFIGIGLSIVYRAMADSSSAVVAPVAAVFAAVLPLVWDLMQGADLGVLATVGCAVAIASLALTTFNPRLGDRIASGLAYALAGGLCFGLSVVLAANTSEASGVWPALTQRFSAFVVVAVLALTSSVPVFLPKAVARFGVLGGIMGAFGMAAWVVGAQQGDLGTVSVIASTYPAVVVLLAWKFDEDELRWWQAVGVAGAILGTALIALGSA